MRPLVTLALSALLPACGGPVDARQRERIPEQDVPPGQRTVEPAPWPADASVVFYNVENLFDTRNDPGPGDDDLTPEGALKWTQERYTRKLQHLAEAIALAGEDLPVLVGLCEVENAGVVEDLARTAPLGTERYAVVHHDSPDERGIDVALLYQERLFNLLAEEALTVPLDNDRTRDILHATLASRSDTFHVFVNHWPSRREGQERSEPKRMAAAAVLASAIKQVRTGPSTHVLVMGDFNDTPTDRSIRVGLGAGCTPTAELVDLMCVDQPTGHGSHQYQGEWAYLDQFMVDRTLAGRVVKANALWDERLLFKHPRYGRSPNKTYSGNSYKGGYSDHLPIVIRLK